MVEVAHDLGDAEDAHGEHGKVDSVGQERKTEGHALLAGLEIGADRGQQHADQDHGDGLQDRAARQHNRKDQTHDHEREVLRRAEDQRQASERGAQRRNDEGRHGAGEERPDGRDAERHAGAALTGHLVAVERGDHGGGLAGNVDQDRRGRAAILGTVVDAGQHDQGAGRIEPEGDRQQHGDGGDGTDAGQHADERTDETAQEGEPEVDRGQGDAEAEAQVGKEITHQILPLWSATSTGARRRLRVVRSTRMATAAMMAAVARSTAFCDQSAGNRPVRACGKTGMGRFNRSPNSTMQNGVRLKARITRSRNRASGVAKPPRMIAKGPATSKPRPGVVRPPPKEKGRIVRAKARMAPMTKTGPRRLQRSSRSPSLRKAAASRARPDRPTPMASQRGSMAGPMALSVPWSRSRVSQSARAASAMRRRPPAKLCGARTGPRCRGGSEPSWRTDMDDLPAGASRAQGY